MNDDNQAYRYAAKEVSRKAKDPCYFCERESDCEECQYKH